MNRVLVIDDATGAIKRTIDAPPEMLALNVRAGEALFLLADGTVAEVHLAWSEHAEADPSFPWTTPYPSLQAWVEQSMIPAHRDRVE